MDYRHLIDAVDKKPFVPFTITLNNGLAIRVGHPEQVIFIPSRAKIWYVTAVDEENDRTQSFEAVAIASIERERGNGAEG